MSNSIEVWADGATVRTNPGVGTWGVFVRTSDYDLCFYGILGVVSNNYAELVSILKAFHFLELLGLRGVTVYTDSDLCHGLICRGFTNKKNKELVEAAKQLCTYLQVDLQHTPSKMNKAHIPAQKAKKLL